MKRINLYKIIFMLSMIYMAWSTRDLDFIILGFLLTTHDYSQENNMINNCPCCNKPPKVNGFVSCENKSCSEFAIEYLVHEWQKLDDDKEKVFYQLAY